MIDFLQAAQEVFEYSKFLRRDFHKHPELGFKEERSSGIIATQLTEMGLEVTAGLAKTGVVGVLDGGNPGKTLLLRFDMDALPILEQNQLDYQSQTNGVMHACGHDGHMAIGLTVARILSTIKHEISGKIKFVFQPAEEGLGGASEMIQAGVLGNPTPDYCLGMHLWNEKPVGWVSVVPGPAMAGADIFSVRIKGKGGHGAIPHQTIDPIQAAALITSSLQTIISRNISPLKSGVVSVTQINAGDAFNVIPQMAELGGTIRSFDEEIRTLIIKRFKEIVKNISGAMGCEAEIDLWQLTPAVYNHPVISEYVKAVFEKNVDIEVDTQSKTMASEDMAEFLLRVPGCFFMVGSANEKESLNYPHHHPKFNFDENALVLGSGLMCSAAVGLLTRQPST